MNCPDSPADSRQTNWQKVHNEPRIHTGANNACPVFLANRIELRGQSGFAQPGKEQLLARRYHADAPAGHRLNLGEGVFEPGNGGVKDDVRLGAIDQLFERTPDLAAPQTFYPRERAQILANLSRVDIHAPNDVRPGLLGSEFQVLQPDRAQAKLCNPNLHIQSSFAVNLRLLPRFVTKSIPKSERWRPRRLTPSASRRIRLARRADIPVRSNVFCGSRQQIRAMFASGGGWGQECSRGAKHINSDGK